MKKLLVFLSLSVFGLSLMGCDFIEEQIQREIDRVESIEFVDLTVDIPARSIRINITSNVDEQLIEAITINGFRYDLTAQGDDWYLLEDLEIAQSYNITNVYYRSGFGPLVPFNINQSFTLREALDSLPSDILIRLGEQPQVIQGVIFSPSEEGLVEIDDDTLIIDEIAEWVWLILEDDLPIFAVVLYEDQLYVILVPEDAEQFID